MAGIRVFVKAVFGTIAVVLVLAVLALAALWFFRLPVAEWAIKTAAARAGYKDVAITVTEVDLSKVTLEAMTLKMNDVPSMRLDRAEATYSWRTLLTDRKIDTLTVGPGVIHGALTDDLTLTVAGQTVPLVADGRQVDAPSQPISIPADRITVRPLTLKITTPGGPVSGVLSGGFAPKSGGSLTARVTGAAAGLSTFTVSDIASQLEVTVDPHGVFTLSGDLAGGLATPIGTVEALQLTATGNGAVDWDEAKSTVNGWSAQVAVDLASAAVALAQAGEASAAVAAAIDALDQMIASEGAQSDRPEGDPLGTVTLSGALMLDVGDDGVRTVSVTPGRALTARNDRNEHFIIEPHTEFLFSASGGERRLSFSPDIKTRWITTRAKVNLSETQTGELSADGEVTLPAQSIALLGGEGQTVFDALRLTFTGNRTANRYFLSLVPEGTIRSIEREPLALGKIRFDGQPIDVTYIAAPPAGVPVLTMQMANRAGSARQSCLRIGETSLRLDPESLLMRVEDARVCPTEKPLLSLISVDPLRARVGAVISAPRIAYRHGDASLVGRPPAILMNGQWDSGAEALTISGDFTGGRAILNDAIGLSKTDGRIQAEIRGEVLSVRTELQDIFIEQASTPQMVAPVRANGLLTYADDLAEFSADIATPDATALGTIRGQHNIIAGKGDMAVDVAALTFLPDGLQPVDLLPGLQGIIADATGGVGGEAQFAWQLGAASTTADDTAGDASGEAAAMTLSSSAMVTARDLTFTGPGRAITATGGVTGSARFVDLLPARSDGVQTIKIGLIDLDAIRLEDGVAEIEFPGDDTVRVIKGEFPWFGGTLGAYDTVAALTGETVTTALRAEAIDLGAFLTFLDIPGLSGEGTVDGSLPIIVEDGRIRVEDAVLRAATPGVIRFDSQVTNEIAKASDETRLAFDILRELTFDTFEATINGALDGQLRVALVFEGTNAIIINKERVPAPVIYRITLEGPLPGLISQRLQFSNFSFNPITD
ncbi:MAG: YdbH domain-containing protein [Pseudomonadota bacterium]